MSEKTTLMQLTEFKIGCSIEQYVQKRTADGLSIPRIAKEIGVTPECLRMWIKQRGGQSRIEFPDRETAAV